MLARVLEEEKTNRERRRERAMYVCPARLCQATVVQAQPWLAGT